MCISVSLFSSALDSRIGAVIETILLNLRVYFIYNRSNPSLSLKDLKKIELTWHLCYFNNSTGSGCLKQRSTNEWWYVIPLFDRLWVLACVRLFLHDHDVTTFSKPTVIISGNWWQHKLPQTYPPYNSSFRFSGVSVLFHCITPSRSTLFRLIRTSYFCPFIGLN